MAVTVQATGAMFSAGNPTRLFDASAYFFGAAARTYDVSADGQQFLMIKLPNQQTSTTAAPGLIVVEHWTEELKARVPTK